MGNVIVKFYAEVINGKIKYFKECRSRFGNWFISKREISKREYEWHTKD